jgi:beta-phosphoglucomutase family hydrolase
VIKAVIFDMDGVIIDSEPLHYKVFMSYTKKKLGFSISDEEYNTFIGTTNKSIFSMVQQKHGMKGDLDTIVEEYEEQILTYLMTNKSEKPIDGVDTLIKILQQSKMKLALASSSPKKQINIILKMFKLEPFFTAAVSGQEVKAGKPAPDIFLRAAELLDVLPEECLVFEDSKNGVLAAKKAGMKCIAFYNPHSGNQDLSQADKIIRSFAEVSNDVECIKSFCG